ncbi:hypothetical protein ACFFX0_06725 [Citricoccus parietis]|uniref:Uncharacterized protein n=1 Tax=Citricoccus parietis TaxID=592307 RepID=A0ABV5FW77_9MICC
MPHRLAAPLTEGAASSVSAQSWTPGETCLTTSWHVGSQPWKNRGITRIRGRWATPEADFAATRIRVYSSSSRQPRKRKTGGHPEQKCRPRLLRPSRCSVRVPHEVRAMQEEVIEPLSGRHGSPGWI